MRFDRYRIAVLIIAAVILAGGAYALDMLASSSTEDEHPKFSPPNSRADETTITHTPDVLVSFAQNGERGQLAELLNQKPNLASKLSASLAPLVQSNSWKGPGRHTVASFQVIGASITDKELWLFAHESQATFYIAGGRLIESGGMSVPVRVRLSAGSSVSST